MSLPQSYRKLVAVRSSSNLREAVEVQETPLQDPGPDEIVVRTAYAGVNAADYLIAAGRYLSPTPPPYDLGAEAVGTVVARGSQVDSVQEGDAVFAIGGGYREYFTIKASHAVPVPAADPTAVTIGISGLTASIALYETGEMRTGETVLVTAAAGGTGSFAVQLAKIAGNHVIGTCSSDEKAGFLRELGCDRPVNYREENLRDVLKEEYPQGLDIVFDGVGGEMYDTALRALAVKGRLLVIGAISEYESGPQPVNHIREGYHLLNKSASIRGFWLMHYLRQARDHTRRLLELLQNGQLQAAVDPAVFTGVEGAIDALAHLYSGQNQGKVVVRFTES